MNWNMLLYVALFLLLVGLFFFSLLSRKVEEQGGQKEPSGPGDAAPEPEDRREGE